MLSPYVGGVYDDVGRNAGYAVPHQVNSDAEVKVLFGRAGVWRGRNIFIDLEAARLISQGLVDETHADATGKIEFARNWQLFVKSYSGAPTPAPSCPSGKKLDASLVRRLDRWRLQGGWRQTV